MDSIGLVISKVPGGKIVSGILPHKITSSVVFVWEQVMGTRVKVVSNCNEDTTISITLHCFSVVYGFYPPLLFY